MSETCRNCDFSYILSYGGIAEWHCSKHNISVSPEGNCEVFALSTIKDSGESTTFDTGAVRDMHEGKGRMDLLPWEALIEVSKHCEEGAKKYGERNCEKGIPIHSLIDSAFRHLAKYTIGMDDEPHLRAAAWNILFALYMEQVHPEMQDIPARMQNLDKS